MKKLLRKYYNSTLTPKEFDQLYTIISDRKKESDILGEMEHLWSQSISDNQGYPEPNYSLLQKIKNDILQEKYKSVFRKSKLYSIGLKIAAVLIIGLLASTIFFLSQPNRNNHLKFSQTVTTPLGAKTSTSLPDGSVVWLNSGSSLSFPNKFDKSRLVKLSGEAFFEVTKNDKPFIVSTEYGEVEVKGTSFNIKAFADNQFETTLVEGMVVVRDKESNKEVTLKPGQQLVRNKDGLNIQEVETQNYTSWTQGKLIFSKEPFPDFITKLERWYNINIEYDNPKLDELWYTGTIEMESVSEVMEMISKAAPLEYSYNNKTRTFTIAPK